MSEPQPYIVTPDVNVYLTVARILGPGFTDDDFISRVREADEHGLDVFSFFRCLFKPHPDGGRIEVWTGQHIIETALYKAGLPQRQERTERTEKCGFGWTEHQSQSIANLIAGIAAHTQGGFVKDDGTYMHPPMDYEDGCVMQCAKNAHQNLNLCRRYCITYDQGMIEAARNSRLVKVVSPRTWCTYLRIAKGMTIMKHSSSVMQEIHKNR